MGLEILLQVTHINCGIVETAILDQLLPVSGHQTLGRGVAVWVDDGRGREEWDVRAVHHTAVEDGRALEAEEDLAVREQRVLVELELSLDRTGVHDADVDAFFGQRVAGAEVIELLELARDVGGGHHPVGWPAKGRPVDDVGHFQRLVEQRDVAVGEVDRGPGCRGEVVGRTDGGGDDQVVDQLTIDFGDHFVAHEVGEDLFGVDVLDGLEILSGFQRPRGLELTGHGGDGVAVDGHREFWLERVVFQVVVVADLGHGSVWEDASTEGDADGTGGVVEDGGTGGADIDFDVVGEVGAVTEEDGVGCTVFVEADREARCGVVAGWHGVGCRGEHFHEHASGEDRAVLEGGRDGGAAAANGGSFLLDGLRGVVRVKGPAVLTGVGLSRVLSHDLRSGDRLALGHGVAVADVEDQAGRLAHRLDAEEVVGDELGVALADEWEGEPGEVGDVGGGRRIFQDHAALAGAPGVQLVFEESGHDAHLVLWNLAALGEDGAPLVNEFVLVGLSADCGRVRVGVFRHDIVAARHGVLHAGRGGRATAWLLNDQHSTGSFNPKSRNCLSVCGRCRVPGRVLVDLASDAVDAPVGALFDAATFWGDSRLALVERAAGRDWLALVALWEGGHLANGLGRGRDFGFGQGLDFAFELAVPLECIFGERGLTLDDGAETLAVFADRGDLALQFLDFGLKCTVCPTIQFDTFKEGLELFELGCGSRFFHRRLLGQLPLHAGCVRFTPDLRTTSEILLMLLALFEADLLGSIDLLQEGLVEGLLFRFLELNKSTGDALAKVFVDPCLLKQSNDLIHLQHSSSGNGIKVDSARCLIIDFSETGFLV